MTNEYQCITKIGVCQYKLSIPHFNRHTSEENAKSSDTRNYEETDSRNSKKAIKKVTKKDKKRQFRSKDNKLRWVENLQGEAEEPEKIVLYAHSF